MTPSAKPEAAGDTAYAALRDECLKMAAQILQAACRRSVAERPVAAEEEEGSAEEEESAEKKGGGETEREAVKLGGEEEDSVVGEGEVGVQGSVSLSGVLGEGSGVLGEGGGVLAEEASTVLQHSTAAVHGTTGVCTHSLSFRDTHVASYSLSLHLLTDIFLFLYASMLENTVCVGLSAEC
eukprot:2033610-Rhodomonas_salina.1